MDRQSVQIEAKMKESEGLKVLGLFYGMSNQITQLLRYTMGYKATLSKRRKTKRRKIRNLKRALSPQIVIWIFKFAILIGERERERKQQRISPKNEGGELKTKICPAVCFNPGCRQCVMIDVVCVGLGNLINTVQVGIQLEFNKN